MHGPHRLRRSADVERARREGRSWNTPLIVLYAARSESDVTRCGFSVSRRLGNAVTRNRVRRRLREIVRHILPAVAVGWDMIITARPAAAAAPYAELQRAVEEVMRRARLMPARVWSAAAVAAPEAVDGTAATAGAE